MKIQNTYYYGIYEVEIIYIYYIYIYIYIYIYCWVEVHKQSSTNQSELENTVLDFENFSSPKWT